MSTKSNIKRFVQNRKGDISLMETMLTDRSISDIDVRDMGNYGDITALMFQAEYGTKTAMEWLLTHDPPATVSLQDSSGRTALTGAVEANNVEKVRLLLEFGADRSAPLEYAKMLNKERQVIRVLETYFPENRGRQLERDRARAKKKEREKELARNECKASSYVDEPNTWINVDNAEANYEVYQSEKCTDEYFKYLTDRHQRPEKRTAESYRHIELEKLRLLQEINKSVRALDRGGSARGSRERDKDLSNMSSLSSPPPHAPMRLAASSKKDVPCVSYFRDGPCRFGNGCPYSHEHRVPV